MRYFRYIQRYLYVSIKLPVLKSKQGEVVNRDYFPCSWDQILIGADFCVQILLKGSDLCDCILNVYNFVS